MSVQIWAKVLTFMLCRLDPITCMTSMTVRATLLTLWLTRCLVDCPNTAIFLNKTGKSMRWLRNYLRENMNDPEGAAKQLTELSGGYQWSCGAMDDMTQFFSKAEVQKVSRQQRNYPYFQLTLFGTRLFT